MPYQDLDEDDLECVIFRTPSQIAMRVKRVLFEQFYAQMERDSPHIDEHLRFVNAVQAAYSESELIKKRQQGETAVRQPRKVRLLGDPSLFEQALYGRNPDTTGRIPSINKESDENLY
jgi:hypothetical protein